MCESDLNEADTVGLIAELRQFCANLARQWGRVGGAAAPSHSRFRTPGALAVSLAERRQVMHGLALGVDGLSTTRWVLAPGRQQDSIFRPSMNPAVKLALDPSVVKPFYRRGA